MEGRVPARLTKSEGRRFAFPVGTAFLVLAGIVWWRERILLAQIFAGVTVALYISGALIPTLLGPVYRGWMGFAHAISKVTTPIFMGIVYYVVVGPIGVLRRALGHNPMVHEAEADSFWKKREKGSRQGNLSRQF